MYIHMYACKCTNEITIVEFKGSEYLSLQVFHKKGAQQFFGDWDNFTGLSGNHKNSFFLIESVNPMLISNVKLKVTFVWSIFVLYSL